MRVVVMGGYPYFLFSEKIGCSPVPFGGVATWMVNLCTHLSRHPDIDVHVITELFKGENDVKSNVFREDKITYHFIAPPRRFRASTFFIQDCIKIHKELKKISPDIVHAHHTDEYALAAVTSGYPSVVTVHGIYSLVIKVLYEGNKIRDNIIAIVERFCIKKVENIISINPYAESFISKSCFGEIYNIENPVNETFFNCIDKSSNPRLLFVGILCPRKGVLEALMATKIVLGEYPNLKLRIVGRFPASLKGYKDIVLRYIDENGLRDHVDFMDYMDPTKIAEEMSYASCLVMTSKAETAPTVISEAMAAAKPVVAMDVGGIRFMVNNGITGFCVPPGDIMGIAKGVINILGDDSLRRKMGYEARSSALTRFHPDVVATMTIKAYSDIIEKNKASIL